MTKLTVVFLKDTGHVLAALTRADPPAAGEQVSAFVDTGLPVAAIGGTPSDVTVPVANLDAITVDDLPKVLLSPQGFQVVQDPQKLVPPKVAGVGVVGSTVDLAIDSTSGASVTVTNVPSDTSLTAVVVMQKVAPSSAAPLIVVGPVTVGSKTVVAAQTGFVTGDKVNMYAFVQKLQPKASPAVAVT
jgi:hypothetical protein